MDRRQIKSRKAIVQAFCTLLKQKDFSRITVQEIIDLADVGRTTFYAHFETKEHLLKALCSDLFDHVASYDLADHREPDTVFLHLFSHLKRNDSNLLGLLSSRNNALFMSYFQTNLNCLISDLFLQGETDLPKELMSGCIAAVFVETVSYWVNCGMAQDEKEITDCFLAITKTLLK